MLDGMTKRELRRHRDTLGVVFDAAARYDVEVVLMSEGRRPRPNEHRPLPRDYTHGPRVCGLSLKTQRLYAAQRADPWDLLHELAHLALGKPGLEQSEGYMLLPFEWELAKHIASPLGTRDRAWFLAGVDDYQKSTVVGSTETPFSDCENGRETGWWANGIRRSRLIGLLNEKGAPTFRQARWENAEVMLYGRKARWWDPSIDDEYIIG